MATADELLPGEQRLFDEAEHAASSWEDALYVMHDMSASVAAVAQARERVLAHVYVCRQAQKSLCDVTSGAGTVHNCAYASCACICCRERFFKSLLDAQERAMGTSRHDRELYARAVVGLSQALVEGGSCASCATRKCEQGAVPDSLQSPRCVFRTLLWFSEEHMRRAAQALVLLGPLANTPRPKAGDDALGQSAASLNFVEDAHPVPRGAAAVAFLERAAIDAEARVVLGDWAGVIERYHAAALRSTDSQSLGRRLPWCMAVASTAQWLETLLADRSGCLEGVHDAELANPVPVHGLPGHGSAGFSGAPTPQRNAANAPLDIGASLASVCVHAMAAGGPGTCVPSDSGPSVIERLAQHLFCSVQKMHALDAARVLHLLEDAVASGGEDRAAMNLLVLRTRVLLQNAVLSLPPCPPAGSVEALLVCDASDLPEIDGLPSAQACIDEARLLLESVSVIAAPFL